MIHRKTGRGLAAFAAGRLGTPYFYGAKWEDGPLTEERMRKLSARYPRIVTEAYMEQAKRQGQVGRRNVDCASLFSGYRGVYADTRTLKATAERELAMDQAGRFPAGTILWKPGHVGVYEGGGRVIEAKGIDWGTVRRDIRENDWVCGLLFANLRYENFWFFCRNAAR